MNRIIVSKKRVFGFCAFCFIAYLVFSFAEGFTSGLNEKMYDRLVAQGSEKLRAGDLEGALKSINNAIDVDSARPLAFGIRAEVLTLQGKKSEAVQDAQHYIQMMPDNAVGYYILGRANLMAGQITEAEANFTKALAIDPSDANTLLHRAKVRAELGNEDGMMSDLKQVYSINPEILKGYPAELVASLKS